MAQAAHSITLSTDQPALQFLSMEGSDGLSRLFEYTLHAVARNGQDVKLIDLLGKPAKVKVAVAGVAERHYHTIVSAARYEGPLGKQHQTWRMTLRPWLWLATRASNVRIFQKMTVPDIVRKVLQPYGGAIELRLQASYEPREYCVQYRESDFAFVSRLMEDEGIFYYFRHDAGKHSLVLADSPGAHTNEFGLARLSFADRSNPDACVTKWLWSEQIRTGKVALRDFTMLTPGDTQEKTVSGTRSHAFAELEAYDYPAGNAAYHESGKGWAMGNTLAQIRLDEQQAAGAGVEGECECVRLATGALFTLDKHAAGAQNGDYVVAATRLKMRLSGYEAGATLESEHHCSFDAFAAKTHFRPPRTTPRPRVAGPQTATVVGASGEEIHVDKHGRVKVQFHWDREGKKDPGSSCYVRVSQPSAGGGWGAVSLPRVGHEVIVDFIEGDPDQPIITGRVYNAVNTLPHKLPDNKSVSTFKTRSTPDGGDADFNELRFEDKKGGEYVLLHAQKDRLDIVEAVAKSLVGAEQHAVVKKNRLEKIEGEQHLTVVKDAKHKVDGKYSLTVTKDIAVETKAKHHLKAAQDLISESGTASHVKAGTELHVKAGQNAGIEAGMNVHLKGGMNVVVEGGMQLTLKVGGSSVVIGPDGVSITGPLVKINSGGAAGSGSGANPQAPVAPDAPTAPEEAKDPL